MFRRLFWAAAAVAFFHGGLALGRAGFTAEPGAAAAVLEPWLW